MPSAPSTRLGLTSPLGTEAPDGPANIATLIAQLEASVGMAKIAELSPTAGVIDFTAIPATWRHLRLVGSVSGTDPSAPAAGLRLRFNTSAVAAYDSRNQLATGANGSAVPTTLVGAATWGDLSTMPDAFDVAIDPTLANGMATFTLDLPDYGSTKWKTWHFNGVKPKGSGSNYLDSVEGGGLWRNVAAITAVRLLASVGSLTTGSVVSLYGLR